MVTAELAVALPAVALSAAVVTAVGQAAVAELHCVDAARAAARAEARGEARQRVEQVAREAAGGAGVEVAVTTGGAEITVTVRRRLRLVLPRGPEVTLSAQASSQAELSHGGEQGAATVLTTAVVALSAMLALVLAGLGSAVVARHRAASAADLSSLAAAAVLTASSPAAPPSDACGVAAAVAERNGARLTRCTTDRSASTVEVSVQVRPAGATGRLGVAVSRARAGPAPPRSGRDRERQGWR